MKRIEKTIADSFIIDKDVERYIAFPDIVQTPSGKLVVVWRESDAHVSHESRLIFKTSDDNGATWSERRILNPLYGHMPRLSLMPNGDILIIDDGASPNSRQSDYVNSSLFISKDDGESFACHELDSGNGRGIPACPCFAPDKIIAFDNVRLMCLSQIRLGTVKKSPDFTFCNMVYRSDDGGYTWYADNIAACEQGVKLCEPSAVRLQDGRILAIYRVNADPPETSYYNFSTDDGYSWSKIKKAPFFGHRPTAGITSEGKLLVTYRKISPPYGTCAWTGTVEELETGGGTELELCPARNIPLSDMGYSGWVELGSGRILCVYHHRNEGEKNSYVKGSFFTLNNFELSVTDMMQGGILEITPEICSKNVMI